MTRTRYDFHIHTKYLGCANQTMEVPAILDECQRIGVVALGITDHLNSPDQIDLHKEILRDITQADTDIDVYFGVELNFMCQDGPFALDPQLKDRYGFQFAIGGIHATYVDEYDLKKIVDIQHRHHIASCRSPMIDVLVHPYWFSKGEFERKGFPWFDSMKAVPEAYARELGQAARDTGTAIEINAMANLVEMGGEDFVKQYTDYVAAIAEAGPLFSVGSDAHDIGQLESVTRSWALAERLGLGEDRIWRPSGTPLNKRG
jgi:histidinol phosphatase-like PHP family hydrolase